jgi:PAS domain S-box-containing protein
VRLELHTVRLAALAAVTAAAGAGVSWWLVVRRSHVPNRVLRIGFEHNPPYQVRQTAGSPTGLVVDAVREAAHRAGIPLEWTETRLGPDRALGTGAVDLWPLVTDLPDRRKVMHISAPWLQSQHVLVLRTGTPMPDREFAGPVSITAVALHVRLLREHFPRALAKEEPEGADALARLCTGEVKGAFLESRLALAVLRERPPPCASVELQAHLLPGTHALGVGSTFAAAGAADRIRDGISELARDGTLAVLMARYSFFGLSDTRATYDLLEAQESNRRLLLVIAGLSLALGLTLWLAWSVRAARDAERRARRAESEVLGRYEVASRAATDAIWEVDFARRRVKWSEAVETLLGAPVPDLETDLRWCEERVHPEDRDRLRARVGDHFGQGDDKVEDEFRFLRADGSYAQVIARGYAVPDAAGRPQRMIGALVDVTRRRQLEEELLQAHKMEAVGRLAGGVAHDFNNLLTAIIGCTELAARRASDDERQARYLREIRAAADRAAVLTTQLLAFSRRQVLHPEVLSLNVVVAEMETLLRRLIGEDVDLVIRLASDVGFVRVDRGQIGQVLMNLCLNGRDAMPRGGRLRIDTFDAEWRDGDPAHPAELRPGAYAVLSVGDGGSGMDRETLRHLFEPFFTTKALGKGTGLGLSSSYGIIRQSGGHIAVESEEGRGTTFRVYLPRVPPPPETAAPPSSGLPLALPDGAETILLAEDDESVRILAAEVLRDHGFTVHEARSGLEALRICRELAGAMHLLLTDVVMPDLDGRELAARVRSARPETKVLFMSGYAGGAILEDLRREGEAFLAKPFTSEAILRCVRDALGASTLPGAR